LKTLILERFLKYWAEMGTLVWVNMTSYCCQGMGGIFAAIGIGSSLLWNFFVVMGWEVFLLRLGLDKVYCGIFMYPESQMTLVSYLSSVLFIA